MMVELAANPERLHRRHHLAAEVGQRIRGRNGKVALLLTELVGEVRPRRCRATGVPESLGGVDLIERPVLDLLVGDVVEHEELGLRPEVGGVGDRALDQVPFCLLGDVARIACVRFPEHRIGD